MRTSIRLFVAVISLSLAATSAAVAAAPSALFNKSIMASWSEARDMETVEKRAMHRVIHHTVAIYVSNSGRLFIQKSRVSHNRGRAVNSGGSSHSPDGTIKSGNNRSAQGREVQIRGRSIVEVVKYDSGARRVEISFDEGFRSCSVSIQHGKEDNAPGQIVRGLNTRLLLVKSTSVSSQNCSIRDGNQFE